jgi:hypothetical protein
MKGSVARYALADRLADVLALIQVLSIGESTHRKEEGLRRELQGPPRSAGLWSDVARQHAEFFRVRMDEVATVSLLARHGIPKAADGTRELPEGLVATLLSLAVEMHDREMRRRESWTYRVPLWAAVIGGVSVLFAALAKALLGLP